MHGLPRTPSLAGWLRLPQVPDAESLAHQEREIPLRGLPFERIHHGRNGLPSKQDPAAAVVSGHVVDDKPESGNQCAGTPKIARPLQLQNGVDHAAQAASSYDPTGTRTAFRRCRGRRDPCRRVDAGKFRPAGKEYRDNRG